MHEEHTHWHCHKAYMRGRDRAWGIVFSTQAHLVAPEGESRTVTAVHGSGDGSVVKIVFVKVLPEVVHHFRALQVRPQGETVCADALTRISTFLR